MDRPIRIDVPDRFRIFSKDIFCNTNKKDQSSSHKLLLIRPHEFLTFILFPIGIRIQKLVLPSGGELQDVLLLL